MITTASSQTLPTIAIYPGMNGTTFSRIPRPNSRNRVGKGRGIVFTGFQNCSLTLQIALSRPEDEITDQPLEDYPFVLRYERRGSSHSKMSI